MARSRTGLYIGSQRSACPSTALHDRMDLRVYPTAHQVWCRLDKFKQIRLRNYCNVSEMVEIDRTAFTDLNTNCSEGGQKQRGANLVRPNNLNCLFRRVPLAGSTYRSMSTNSLLPLPSLSTIHQNYAAYIRLSRVKLQLGENERRADQRHCLNAGKKLTYHLNSVNLRYQF